MSTHQSSQRRRPRGADGLGDVAVFGCGLIGGSIALRLRRGRRRAHVLGVDRAGVLERALARRAIDEATTVVGALERMAARPPGVIVLALPVDAIIELIPRLARVSAGLPGERRPLIVDVGSVKGTVVATARDHDCARFVGGHPMAGSERGGIDHADADLFEGTTFALCPSSDRRADLRAARDFVARLGARPLVLDAADHDRAVAMTSHVPHLVAWACMDAARELQGRLADRRLPWSLSGGSWSDATRVAASDPGLWSGIVRHNRDAVLESLDLLIDRLERTRACIRAGDDPLSSAGDGLPGRELARLARRRAKPTR